MSTPRKYHQDHHDHHHDDHHSKHRTAPDRVSPVTITLVENGPYSIRGNVRIVTPEGKVIETEGQEIHLCRCGQSANKPFCDEKHKQARLQSDLAATLAEREPQGYEDVCAEHDVPEGELKGFTICGNPVVLSRIQGQLYAIGGICTHKRLLLEEGKLDGWTVCCPRHGGAFDIRTGQAVRPPAVTAVPTYDVKVERGRVLISRGPRSSRT